MDMRVVGNCIGYFAVLGIFLVLAVVKACKKSAWPLFFTGAGIQLLAMIGTLAESGTINWIYWIVYVILLAVAAFQIRRRRENDKKYSA